jgi:pimeloyl-ACP methyl ester carboxylesterase
MTMARSNRSDYVDPEGTQTQIGAVVRWANRDFAFEGSYDRLQELQIPVLIANGDNDIIIPTNNSWIMFKKLVNADAHLHLFPDVGHGFLNEYADQFSKLINIFLDA